MPLSPRRSWLYRSRAITVISLSTLFALAVAIASDPAAAQGPLVQYGRKTKVDNGPRAVGLVQLPEKGKPRLIPIAIMVDGKFFDADSYKAAPVPMAVDFGVVYEAFQAGVSQGIFTITQPGQLEHTWIAEGKWLSAGMRAAAEKKKKYTAPVIEDENGPPVLHRRKSGEPDTASKKAGDSEKSKAKDEAKDNKSASEDKGADKGADKDKDNSKSGKDDKAGGAGDADKNASTQKTAADQKPGSDTKPAASAAPNSSSDEDADPNRPRLRRGAPPDPSVRRDVYAKFEALPAPVTKPSGDKKLDAAQPAAVQITTYPAVSDAGGPEPIPYVYDVKPSEEISYRAKMLELAGEQVRGPGKDTQVKETKAVSKKAVAGKTTAKSSKVPKVEFDDVSLRFFDLSNSNEPVLVLSAKARMVTLGASDSELEPKDITLIARTNLEGDLKKVFFSQTDSRHLDETPRMAIVDAVDADGDGRGELLFRRIYDTGSSYGIYRVAADKLWPLFEGTR